MVVASVRGSSAVGVAVIGSSVVGTSVSLGGVIKVDDGSLACGVLNCGCVLSCPLRFLLLKG